MPKWLRRVRATVAMGITWALVWAPVGPIIGMIVDADGSMDEPWILIGALPGFVAGMVFSIVIGIAARKRRLDELSVPRFAGLGALAGVIVSAIPFAIGDLNDSISVVPFVAILTSSLAAASAASASATLWIAKRAQQKELRAGYDNLENVGLSESEVKELLGGR